MQKIYAPCLMMACAALALAGCTNNSAMPTGYMYHHEVYKAPPGPEMAGHAVSADPTAQDTTMTEQGSLTGTLSPSEQQAALDGYGDAESFRTIADDLVQRMITNFGRPTEPVLVKDTSPMTAALKAALSRHNVPVAANPGDGPFVIEHSLAGTSATIVFFSNHGRVTSETGLYSGAAPAR